MEDLSNYLFTPGHEWVRVEGRKLVIGFSDYAQANFGDALSVELPEPGDHHYEFNEEIGAVEGDASTREIRAPLSGFITAINTRLLSHPELLNQDPYGEGWLAEMKPDSMDGLEDLLHVDEYEEALPEEEDE